MPQSHISVVTVDSSGTDSDVGSPVVVAAEKAHEQEAMSLDAIERLLSAAVAEAEASGGDYSAYSLAVSSSGQPAMAALDTLALISSSMAMSAEQVVNDNDDNDLGSDAQPASTSLLLPPPSPHLLREPGQQQQQAKPATSQPPPPPPPPPQVTAAKVPSLPGFQSALLTGKPLQYHNPQSRASQAPLQQPTPQPPPPQAAAIMPADTSSTDAKRQREQSDQENDADDTNDSDQQHAKKAKKRQISVEVIVPIRATSLKSADDSSIPLQVTRKTSLDAPTTRRQQPPLSSRRPQRQAAPRMQTIIMSSDDSNDDRHAADSDSDDDNGNSRKAAASKRIDYDPFNIPEATQSLRPRAKTKQAEFAKVYHFWACAIVEFCREGDPSITQHCRFLPSSNGVKTAASSTTAAVQNKLQLQRRTSLSTTSVLSKQSNSRSVSLPPSSASESETVELSDSEQIRPKPKRSYGPNITRKHQPSSASSSSSSSSRRPFRSEI
ncbi:hypothetical protein RI367_005799 [Sorochytrium milnesiophthora]